MRHSLAITALVMLTVTGAVQADLVYTIQAVVLEGDSVGGVGLVTRIDNIAVNNAGDWLVEADTDNADADADSVLLASGVLYLREGDALPLPAEASLGSFDSVTMNSAGNGGFNFFLDGTGGSSDDSGVYWNTTLVFQESEEAPGLTAGTPFIGFFDVKINDAEQLLLTASVDDVNIPTSVDRALYVLDLDGSGGLTGYTLIAAEGDTLPGQTETVADFGTGPHQSAMNDAGNVLFFADLNGSTATDGTIYLYDGSLTLLAQEGDVSPVSGRNWSTLSSPELDVNNTGQYVHSGSLSGDTSSNLLLVKDGKKFMQEGDTLPAIGGVFTFTSFGSGPLEISDRGDVLWYGDWNDPNTDVDTGLFVNDVLLVQEGVTMIDGVPVDTLRGVEDGYHMSPDGEYVIFEAILADGTEGAFLITLDWCANETPCDANCDGVVDGFDIDPFVLAIGNLQDWLDAGYTCDPLCVLDINGDGAIDGFDIDPFVVCVGGG